MPRTKPAKLQAFEARLRAMSDTRGGLSTRGRHDGTKWNITMTTVDGATVAFSVVAARLDAGVHADVNTWIDDLMIAKREEPERP